MSKPNRLPDQAQQQLLDEVRVQLAEQSQLPDLNRLLDDHHCLGSLKPAGERLCPKPAGSRRSCA
jgi:hypothetical protein